MPVPVIPWVPGYKLDREVPVPKAFEDLLTFARLEVSSGDLEPWATVIKELARQKALDTEHTLWYVKLYNAFDTMASACQMFNRWDSPQAWIDDPVYAEVAWLEHTQERRNLRGGKSIKHFWSYAELCEAEHSQEKWLRMGLLPSGTAEENYLSMMQHTQLVWGVGRLASFEWVEFLAKVMGWPVSAPDAQLWGSSGPRESLEKLYALVDPKPEDLNEAARHCRGWLAANGVSLPWEDFETVICDFNVMRKGRYYPGRHLAALRCEVEELSAQAKDDLITAFMAVIPEGWREIPPGIDKSMMPLYMNEGVIYLPDEVTSNLIVMNQ